MSRILIVEDEVAIADLEKDYLELSGFEVEVENDGTSGLARALAEDFDLFILDLMLPGIDGFEICKRIREKKNTPILMVSAKKDDIDKIRGLGLGADDYVTKPFSPSELVARVKAHLARYERLIGSATPENDIVEIRGIKIDKTARRVWVNGEEKAFTTKEFDLFTKGCDFTDDSVMTIAVGEALLAVGTEATVKKIEETVVTIMQDWGKRYPYAGYGGRFRYWLRERNPKPYGSYGNGSAMRVSAAGWLYNSIEKTREVARATANVTHNHPEGIKGAESTASAIYMARNGSSKEEIKAYIEREFHYDLSRTLDNIRTYYHHVESCQETVPEAIIAFLESKDFEDAIRNAVSLGGDTDTLGAITGSIAEAFYGIPAVLIAECKSRIDKGLMTDVLDEFDHVLGRSVDTYSDEVDETQANQMIEAAIDQYYIQQDKNGMLLFMEVMVTRMQQAGEVIVPYITENPFMSEEQISKVKAGDTISLDHDVRLKIETVKDADEKEWIGVFTSSEEMHKGSAGNVQMNQSIESILRLALNWEQVNGIVINPFGKYIQMTKKMIELLINGYEYYENERKSKDDENN